MENRVAVISMIVEDRKSAEDVNRLLSEYGDFIIGRMGVPHKERGIQIISIAIDAPQDTIATLAGKIGNIPGGKCKGRVFFHLRRDKTAPTAKGKENR